MCIQVVPSSNLLSCLIVLVSQIPQINGAKRGRKYLGIVVSSNYFHHLQGFMEDLYHLYQVEVEEETLISQQGLSLHIRQCR